MTSWARAARPSCSLCGNVDIVWLHALELPWRCRPEDRRRAVEGLTLFGGDAEAWLCEPCGQFGIFGPTELHVSAGNRAARRSRARR